MHFPPPPSLPPRPSPAPRPRASRLLVPLALIAVAASGQTTITFTGGQNSSTTYDTGSGALIFTIASGTATQSGTVSGAGGITKTGAGTLQLTGAADNAALTATVNAGTLVLAKASSGSVHAIGGGSTSVTINNGGTAQFGGTGGDQIFSWASVAVNSGGTLDLNGRSEGFNNLTGPGLVTNSAAATTGTLTLGENNGSASFDGTLQNGAGTLALTKAGTGALTLTGATTYTGATTINQGTLTFTQPVRSQAWSLASGAVLELNLASAGTFDFAPVSVTVSGSGTLKKTGAGLANFSGAATFALSTGALIDLQGGTFNGGSNANDVWTDNLSDLNVAAGATFSGVEANVRVDTLTGSGTIRSGWVGAGYSSFTFGVDNGSGTFTGVLADTDASRPGNYVKAGTGTQILTGANTFTGTMTVSAGTLQIGNGGTTGSLPGNVTNNATLAFNRSDATTFSGVISGSGTTRKLGAGTLTLAGANTFSGVMSIEAGTLALTGGGKLGADSQIAVYLRNNATLDLGGTTQTISSLGLGTTTGRVVGDIANGTLVLARGYLQSGTFSNTFAGNGYLEIGGDPTATVTLNGTNNLNYAAGFGVRIFSAGTVRIGNPNALSAADDDVSLASGTLDLNGAAGVRAKSIAMGGSGAVAIVNQNTSSAASFANPISLSSTASSFGGAGNLTLGGVISGSGGLEKIGSGILTLSGVATYADATTISAGTLRLAGAGQLPSSTTVAVASGATLDLNGASNTIAALTGAGNVALGSGTLTTGGNNASTTFSGVISGSGGLTKVSFGTLTLSGNSTYTGATTLSAGTLVLGHANGAGTTGTVTVASGATFNTGIFGFDLFRLDGAGTVTGSGTFSSAAGVNQSLSVLLTGAAALSKAGTGTLTLTRSNTYTGGTTISTGTLALGDANGAGADGTITIASGATFDTAAFGFDLGRLAGTGTVTGSGTFTSSSAQALALTLAGTASLSKQGSGTLTLSGNNSYTGGTAISVGTLVLGHVNGAGTTGTVTVATGTTLDTAGFGFDLARLDGAGTVTGSGVYSFASALADTVPVVLAGSASLAKAGTGTLTLSANNTYTGATTISAGTLRLSGAGRLSDATALTVSSGATFDLNGASDTIGSIAGAGNVTLGSGTLTAGGGTTFSGVISGTGGFTKTGGGALVLTNANTYTGATTISAGTLQLSGAGRLSDATALTVSSGAIFDLNSISDTIGSIAGAGNVTLGSGTVTTGGNNASTTFSGVISGSGGLIKTGSGKLILSGTSTYTGATTISDGTLQIGNGGATGSVVGSIIDNAALAFNRTGSFTVDSLISGSGTVTVSGTGTLTLTASSAFTGGLTINAGTVQLGNSGMVLSDLLPVTVNSGTLRLGTADETIGSLAGTLGVGTVDLFNGSGRTLTVGGNDATTTYLGDIAGTNGSLVKTGNGTLTLGGFYYYTGATRIERGTLQFLSSAATPFSSAFFVGPGATLAVNGGQVGSLSGAGTVTLGDGTVTRFGSGASSTFTGIVSGTGGLTQAGDGTLVLAGDNAYTGPTAISAGTLQIGDGSAPASLASGSIANNASLVFNHANHFIYAGAISGAGNLTKTGTGTLTLSGANTYTGATTLAAGTLALGSGDALGTSGGILFGGGILQFSASNMTDYSARFSSNAGQAYRLDTNGRNVTLATALTSSGGSLVKSGAGTLTLSGANTYTGGTTVSAGTLALSGSGTLGASTNALTLSGGNLDLGGLSRRAGVVTFAGGTLANGTLTGASYDAQSGSVSAVLAGSAALTKSTAGTLTLSGANTYSGGTTISAGTLAAGNASALGTGAVRIDAGTLDLGGYAVANALDVRGGSLTGLAAYTGTQTLRSAASYSGSVGGALIVASGASLNTTSATFTGNLTVQNGATLAGTGTINFATIAAGAIVAPGNSPGTLTFTHGLSLADGSFLDFQLGSLSDLIRVTGGVLSGPTSAGGITLNLSDAGGFDFIHGGTYTLFDFTGATLNGFDPASFTFGSLLAGTTAAQFSLALNGDTLALTYAPAGSAVPDPAAWTALAGLAALGFAAWRRRTCRSA